MNTMPDDSPLLEEDEVVSLLGISPKELIKARTQGTLRAERYRRRWWHLYPAWRYRLRALWDFARRGEDEPESEEGYHLPGERVFQLLCDRAIADGASDIHVQCERGRKTYVRFRINGTLHPNALFADAVAHHLFGYLALREERDPREQNTLLGCTRTMNHGREYWVRYSSVKAQYGMATTLHILPPAAPTDWAELGMTDSAQQAEITQLLESPHPGLTLFTAPQGEGLTTTLRCALYRMNRPENNLVFLDDIIDFPTGAVTRVLYDRQHRPYGEQDVLDTRATRIVYDRASGITPDTAVKIAQRQDATILVFGEITDAEAARAAIQAVEAGIRVWAGVRVPDFAMDAVPQKSAEIAALRFRQWGMESARLERVLRGVVMQRLMRCLCPRCKQSQPLTGMQGLQIESYKVAAPEVIYQAVGCGACQQSGYNRRTGVFSVYAANPVSRPAKSFAEVVTERLARGETDAAEIKRLDAWGMEPGRDRYIANNELVQK